MVHRSSMEEQGRTKHNEEALKVWKLDKRTKDSALKEKGRQTITAN